MSLSSSTDDRYYRRRLKRQLYRKLLNKDFILVINSNQATDNNFLSRIGVIILSIVVITVAVIWYDLIKGTFRALVPQETALHVAVIITIFVTVLLIVLVYLFSLDQPTDDGDLSDDLSDGLVLPVVS